MKANRVLAVGLHPMKTGNLERPRLHSELNARGFQLSPRRHAFVPACRDRA